MDNSNQENTQIYTKYKDSFRQKPKLPNSSHSQSSLSNSSKPASKFSEKKRFFLLMGGSLFTLLVGVTLIVIFANPINIGEYWNQLTEKSQDTKEIYYEKQVKTILAAENFTTVEMEQARQYLAHWRKFNSTSPVLLDLEQKLGLKRQGNLYVTEKSVLEIRLVILLDKAKKALTDDKLDMPVENNAVYYVQQMLTLSPKYPSALQLLTKIVDRYIEQVHFTLNKVQLQLAQAFQQKAQVLVTQYALNNHDDKLKQLQIAIDKKVAQADLETRLASLVDKTKRLLANNRLSTQVEDNAVDYAQQVFALAPTHPATLQILIEVVDRFIELSTVTLNEGLLQAAQHFQKKAETLVVQYTIRERDTALLQRLQSDVDKKVAERTELKSHFASLVDKTKQALAKNRLNAVSYAQQVLTFASQYPEISQWAIVIELYIGLTKVALTQKQLQMAQTHYEQALFLAKQYQVKAHNEALKRLHADIKQQIAQADPKIRFANLSDKVKIAIANNQLTIPPRDNAVDYIKQMLALSPNNSVAQQFLKEVMNRYIELIKTALNEEQLKVARSHLLDAEILTTQYNFLKRYKRILKQLHKRIGKKSASH
jgi:hypothetical protein